MRYNPPGKPLLRAAVLTLALALLAPATLAAGPAASSPELVPAAEVLARVGTWRQRLEARREAMEERWGYTGARRTTREAFVAADLPEAALQRAAAWGNRLYVLWGKLTRWYARHDEALAALEAVVEGQGGAPADDLAWVEERTEDLWRATAHLEAGLDVLLDLRVRQAATAVEIARLEAVAKRGGGMLERLGGGGASSMVEVRARAGALAASEAWLADALLADAERTLVPALEPVADRPSYRIVDVALVGPAGERAPVTAAPAARPGALAGVMIPAAAAATALPVDVEAARTQAFEADLARDRARDLRRALESTRRPSDLPEVRDLMGREKALQARIDALRAEIKATDLDAPGGQERARELAGEVLALRQELPAIRTERTRRQSDDYLAAWREDRRAELAAALADAGAARAARADALARAEASAGTLGLALARRRAGEAGALLREIRVLEAAAARRPAVASVTLRAGDAEVFTARRLDAARLASLREEITAAREDLLALAALSEALGARALEASHRAALEAARRDPGAPDAFRPDLLGAAVRRLGVDRAVGEDLLAVRGKALAARYAKLSRETPEPGRAWSPPDGDRVLERFRGAGDDEPARTSTTAATLEEVAGRMEALVEGRHPDRAAAEATEPVETRGPGAAREAAARKRLARLHLEALLWRPLAREAAQAATHAAWELDRAVREARAGLAPYDRGDGFHVSAGPAFLAGAPLEATVTLTSADRRAPVRLRLGGRTLEPGAPAEGVTARYTLRRADGLEGDAAALALELPASDGTL